MPKVQSCPFVSKLVHIVSKGCWFQIHTYIFESPTRKSIFGPIEEILDCWNSKPKIAFRSNLGPKIETCLFFLKIGPHTISRMLVLKPDLNFCNFDPTTNFLANLCPNLSNLSFLSEYRSTYYLKDADSESRLRFLKFQP